MLDRSSLVEFDQSQALNDPAIFQVFFDDLVNVLGSNLGIPNTVRINQYGCADRAKTDRAAVRQNDRAHWITPFGFLPLPDAFLLEFLFERGLYRGAPYRRARLSIAHKNVMPDRSLGHGRQLFELIAIRDEFGVAHYNYFATKPPPVTSHNICLC